MQSLKDKDCLKMFMKQDQKFKDQTTSIVKDTEEIL